MADNEQNTAAQEEQGPQFAVQRVYIKDASFESPNAPEIFMSPWQPEVGLEMNTQTNQVGDSAFEVVLTLTVTVKNDDKTAFLVELQQGGIFGISGLGEQEMHHTLGAFCPSILFPYAREAIDAMVVKASFPALMLAPVNFDALYAQQMSQAQQEATAEAQH
ncbi:MULTISPECIES: protein-export chaperone SecB [unclassified Neptuniibacter]|jgi:preprotein translocase subunit SecB|uniref:protein-export chaperone SecB n=1 Tax=unclassified Neptuniibacter TaxID=2630693 RepID=UPI000C389EFF|nr:MULTISPECIES: protein-export chaperone SecB [unclassified Neptuniibacter]MAY42139.1 protein-export chaperone SecB [Oceanospirillaceae bacterium]|tara:strand:+ start:26369 stop:26854 length:486 start_codon:yes stop_codon:yes gene_type:complete